MYHLVHSVGVACLEVAEADAQSAAGALSPSIPETLAAKAPSSNGAPAVPRPVKSLGTLRERVSALLLVEELEPVVFLLLVTHSRLRLYPADVARLVRLTPSTSVNLNDELTVVLFTALPWAHASHIEVLT